MAKELKFGDKKRDAARKSLRFAMVSQFNAMYGRDADDLQAWQQLCCALGADPIPDTITKCRQVSSQSTSPTNEQY